MTTVSTLPKKFFFALEAVLYVACHTGVRPVSSKEICAKNGLNARYLEPIMQQLVHANILRGVRGPKGGYFLARERRKINAAEIFQMARQMEEEQESLKATNAYHKSVLGEHIIFPLWEGMETYIVSQLETLTVEDLCKQAEEKNIVDTIRNMSDFVI